MRVLYPWAENWAEARKALPLETTVPVDVRKGTYHYFRWLKKFWEDRPFVVVEHDIVIRPEVLPELEACPEPWCVWEYRLRGIVTTALGCAKFGAELCDWYLPEWWAEWQQYPPRWDHLDGYVATMIEHSGVKRHVHGPPLDHCSTWGLSCLRVRHDTPIEDLRADGTITPCPST